MFVSIHHTLYLKHGSLSLSHSLIRDHFVHIILFRGTLERFQSQSIRLSFSVNSLDQSYLLNYII